MPIDNATIPTAARRLVDYTPQMTRQLGHPDPKPGSTRGQRLRRVAIDEAVLVDAGAEDGFRLLLRDAIRGIPRLAGQRLLMAQPCAQVVEVVVEPGVPGGVGYVHARHIVELREQRRRGVQMLRPVRRFAAYTVGRAELVGRGARVARLQGVDRRRLDGDADGRVSQLLGKLAFDHLPDDLRRDDVVGDAVRDFLGVVVTRQEAQEAVVHGEQVRAVLARVVESLAGDLRELAAAVEAGGRERVRVRGRHLPVDLRGGPVWARRAVVEQCGVGARPCVCLAWECVGRVRGAFVVPVDLRCCE